MQLWRSLTKIAGSGSISQKYGSADPKFLGSATLILTSTMRMRVGGPSDVRAPPCGHRRRRRTQEGLCRVSPPDQTDKRTGAGRLLRGQGEGGGVNSCTVGSSWGVRIRIRIHHFRLNTDRSDPGALRPKLKKKLQLKNKIKFFWIKNYNLPVPRPPSRTCKSQCQVTNEAFSSHKKTSSTSKHEIFFYFCGHFCPPRKKNLDSYCFVTFFWLFIFENDVNVPSKINKQENFLKKLPVVFCLRLEGQWRK